MINIEKIKIEFLKNFPLLGILIYKIDINISREIETLAVYFDDKKLKYVLLINPSFFNSLSKLEKMAVLQHEMYHIYFQHNIRINNIKNVNFKIANIAADISINQYIKNLPKNALFPETYGLPKLLNFEKYYDLLINDENLNKKLNNLKNKTLDEHDKFFKNYSNNKVTENDNNDSNFNNEENEFKKNMEKNITKRLLQEITKEIYQRKKIFKEEIKDIPEELKDILNHEFQESRKLLLNNEIKLNLNSYIRNWLDKIIITNYYNYSWKFVNRRFQEQKGRKKIKSRKILIAIDTSLSISEKLINVFLNIIFNNLNLLIDEITVILFHDKIYFEKRIKNKKEFLNILKEIKPGGTNIQKVFDFAKEKKYQYLILLTDGITVYPLNSYNINILWINDENDKMIVKHTKEKIIKENPLGIY